MKRLLLSLLLVTSSLAAVMCGDNGAIYDNANLCSSVCSTPCSQVIFRQDGGSSECDKSKFQGFVYYNGKTYALSKNTGFWGEFNNLAIITDKQINKLLAKIISYYNTNAWIGLYDPNHSSSYNSVNPNRFIWRDGTPVGYTNWKAGQPDNFLPDEDIGIVPIYGEHWVFMNIGGLWEDTGYHKQFGNDYIPKHNALVEWNGPLDCVNGYIQNTGISSVNLTNTLCNGVSPCYVCTSDGTDFQKCDVVTDVSNNSVYSCPINRQLCVATYEDPTCPPGGTFNANTGKCEANPLPL